MKNDLPDLNAFANVPAEAHAALVSTGACQAGRLASIEGDGSLIVELGEGRFHCCDVLIGANAPSLRFDDRVIVLCLANGQRPVVLGRVGRYTVPQPQPQVTIEATESLTLKCGEAQVDLRADGKVMVKGDDVLIRAKGTQRIRAGTVAIN